MKQLESIQLERRALGGIIKYPDVFPDISGFANSEDFTNSFHESIFIIIFQRLSKGQSCEPTLIAQELKNLGITPSDDINAFDYIDSLPLTQIAKNSVKDVFKELSSLRIKREIACSLKSAYDFVVHSNNKSVDEVITETDKIYNADIKNFATCENTSNIFEGIDVEMISRSENPVEDVGFLTQFPEFNRLEGGLRKKNLYAIVARPGQGKSNFLTEISLGVSIKYDFKVKVLYLDTENETSDIKNRILSSLSGVPFWYIETGNWGKNPEYKAKVLDALSKIKNGKFVFHHYKVANKSIDEICSLAKRWFNKNINPLQKESCIVVYDYVKITTEKIGANQAEHQVIGSKIDRLKKLSEEIDSVVLTAIQANKTGETYGKKSDEIIDDSSIISLSDRLQWFASYIGFLRQKTSDELLSDGPTNGTHKLIKFKGRFQGRDAIGHKNLIRRKIGSKEISQQQFINFELDNFKVIEKGSIFTIVEAQAKKQQTQIQERDSGRPLL